MTNVMTVADVNKLIEEHGVDKILALKAPTNSTDYQGWRFAGVTIYDGKGREKANIVYSILVDIPAGAEIRSKVKSEKKDKDGKQAEQFKARRMAFNIDDLSEDFRKLDATITKFCFDQMTKVLSDVALKKAWYLPATASLTFDFKHPVQTHYSILNEKHAGEKLDDDIVRIDLDMTLYGEKMGYRAGTAKTYLYDRNKPQSKDGKITFPKVLDENGQNYTMDNVHEFVTKGSKVYRLVINCDKVSYKLLKTCVEMSRKYTANSVLIAHVDPVERGEDSMTIDGSGDIPTDILDKLASLGV